MLSAKVDHQGETTFRYAVPIQKRVLYTQDWVKEALDRAGEANKAAILAIESAVKTPTENSMGFHNPQKFLETLADSIDLARQAELKANQALYTAAKTTAENR